MFASKSIGVHLGRGVLGFGAIAVASAFATEAPWSMLVALRVALFALRGCPMCWTVGLVQTVIANMRGVSRAEACTDGSCALRSRA
jgi:hypothetical protein